jgi:soluble lytic murein transglycosylase
MNSRFILVVFTFVLLAAGGPAEPARAAPPDEESRRRDYTTALAALKAGNPARFQQLRQSLDGYVLRGYLDYEYLKDRVGTTPPKELQQFLNENGHLPVSDALRKKWLRLLASRGDWEAFLREFEGIEDDPELQCLRLNRLLRTSEQQLVLMGEIEGLWLTGRRLPPTCESVFAAWKKAGHMTPEKVWERVRLAMENRNLGLAGEIALHLDPRDRIWVTRWQAMHRDPVRELDRIQYPVETPVARMIVKHGVVRLAYRDPEEAMRRWERLKENYLFFGEDDNYVLRYLGILAAQDRSPEAVKWLSNVSADPSDESLHLWRVRAALRAGEWEAAKRFIAGLTDDRQRQGQWRYWIARILDETGQKDDARRIYAALARERGYYGFLAADRVGAEYAMQHQPVEASPEEVSAMLARPGIQAAQELYALGNILDARRQWSWTIRHMNNRELAVAAVIARAWGWYDRAILTVSRSDHQDDLELRFPLLYRDMIEANATQYGVDPGWVYGVVRQESAFVTDARSQAGALGLMQLMPQTGRQTGRKLKVNIPSRHALLNIETNLRVGVGYLKDVLTRHNNHQVLATAAYNAGPHRVSGWVPQGQALDADIWVETIPFNETRDYVKNVMAYTAVYDYRLGSRPVRLQNRMPAVEPAP